MNTTHKATLLAAFVISFFVQPSWFYINFWAKAVFHDSIPLNVPYYVYETVAALLATVICELVIRSVKKVFVNVDCLEYLDLGIIEGALNEYQC